MKTTFELCEQEAEEVFRIFRNIVDDAHYRHHPKTEWPLYDRLSEYLNESSLKDHNDYLQMRDEEYKVDQWREEVRIKYDADREED